MIKQASETDAKRFLDDLSEEKKEKVLSIKDCHYNGDVTSITGEVDIETGTVKENKKFHGTYLEYLYSDYFKDYVIQDKTLTSSYTNWFDSAGGYAYYKVEGQSGKGKISVKSSGRTQNVGSYTVTGHNDGGFNFNDMNISGGGCMANATSNNGSYVYVGNMKGTKTAHRPTDGVNADRPDDSKASNPVEHKVELSASQQINASANCETSFTATLGFSNADEDCSQLGGGYARTYTLKIKDPGTKNGESSSTTPSTCATHGSTVTTTQQLCKKCSQIVGYSSSTTTLPFADHAFNGSFVDYDNNNHIRYCDNYANCQSVNPGGYQLQAHSWPGWTLDYGPTCQRDGRKHRNCTVCNAPRNTDSLARPLTGEHADIAKLPHNDGLNDYGDSIPNIQTLVQNGDINGLNTLYAKANWNYETSNGIDRGRRYTHCTNGCDRIVLNQYYVSVTKDNDSIKDVTNANNYYEVATPKTGVYAHQGGNWQNTQTVSLTANPLIGHHFVRFTSAWMGGNSANQTHTFSMPAGAVAIHAEGDINISTLVVNPNFVSNRYKKSCDAYWDGSSDVRSFGPKDWHTKKDIPVPTRVGYDFSGWDFSSDHPTEGPGVMSSLTAAAVFTYGSDWAPVSTDTITASDYHMIAQTAIK